MSERPEHHRPRRLADWINPAGARKVHSLIDKVYKRKNLEIARERVKANHGAGGLTQHLMEEVIGSANLNRAYQRVKANGGAAGVDAMSVSALRAWMAAHRRRA